MFLQFLKVLNELLEIKGQSFWYYLQFFQKTNEKIQPNYYGTSSRIVFVRFLEELKTPRSPFEINLPLASL